MGGGSFFLGMGWDGLGWDGLHRVDWDTKNGKP